MKMLFSVDYITMPSGATATDAQTMTYTLVRGGHFTMYT